jgi:uridine nucleosidase
LVKKIEFEVKIIKLQIYGDPEAADIVFTSGAEIVVVGINITTQVTFTGYAFLISQNKKRIAKGKFAKFICNMCISHRISS